MPTNGAPCLVAISHSNVHNTKETRVPFLDHVQIYMHITLFLIIGLPYIKKLYRGAKFHNTLAFLRPIAV